MSEKKVVDIEWNGSIGTVTDEQFHAGLPKDLTERHFEQVDNYRNNYMATISEQVLAKAPGFFEQEPEGTLSIPEVMLGGNGVGSIDVSAEYDLLVEVTIGSNNALADILDKAKDLAEE